MRRSTMIAAATTVVLAAGGMSATAWADDGSSATGSATSSATGSATSSSSTGTATPDWAGRLDRACRRVDRSIRRAEKVQKRIGAGADTKGSIAFLQRRIDAANLAGQKDLAALLSLRLQARQQIAGQLPKRIDLLTQAKQICAKDGK
jgi:hypothetical protein